MGASMATATRTLATVAAVLLAGYLALQMSGGTAPAMREEMVGAHAWWYMGRASGFAAYGLLFGSIVLGLGISSRVFDGLLMRSWVYDLHQFLSVYVVLTMAFHALIMLPDPYANFGLADLTVPFVASYRPFAVGLGVIVLYGSAIVTLSFYAKDVIGQRGWRVLHFGSFALFAGALAHGVLAGTDTRESWAQIMYLASGFVVVFLVIFRVLASRRQARAAGAAAARRA
jgi:predicted ferric reductase